MDGRRWLRSLLRRDGEECGPVAAPHALAPAFKLHSGDQLQDLLCALLLSECVYKVAGGGPEAALQALTEFRGQFPPGSVHLSEVQFCRRRVGHRYMLASGGGAMVVAFMGTKELRDLLTDALLVQQVLWPEAGQGGAVAPAAHRGFLNRSSGVPVESLYLQAQSQGRRLVLCGHSLGGAVATLVTLRLLAALPEPPPPGALSCICFGTPALGNAALAAHIERRQWSGHFYNYSLPQDPVPRLFLFPHAHLTPGSVDAAGPSSAQLDCGSSGGGSSSAQRAGVSSAVEVLLKEEAPAESQSVQGSSEAEAGERGGQELEEAQASGDSAALQPLPQRHWAQHTLRAVARTAFGAVRLPPLPSYPAFTHFGTPLFLLPDGVSDRVPPGSPPAQPPSVGDSGDGSRDASVIPRGWMSAHGMWAYRGRVLHMCKRALQAQGLSWTCCAASSEGGELQQQPAVAEGHSLAPQMRVHRAEADLPVLWARRDSAREVSASRRDAQVKEAGAGAWWRARVLPGGSAPAGAAELPGSYTVEVCVWGTGLDLCCEALLQLPGGVEVEAATLMNAAKQEVVDAIAAPARLPPPALQQASTKPALMLRFAAPATALLQLHAGDEARSVAVVLLSDFARATAGVNLRSKTAWLVGPDLSLCHAAFARLEGSASADAAAAAAVAAATRRPRWLPLSLAAGHNSTSRFVGDAAVPVADTAVQSVGSGTEEHRPAALPHPHAQRAQRAVSWTQRIRERLLHIVAAPAQSSFPALLLRGVSVLDASLATGAGAGRVNPAESLALTAELLRWEALRRGPAGHHDDDWGLFDPEEEEEGHLSQGGGLGARVRKSVRQAGSSVRRRALLLQRWRSLCHLPPPDLLVLLLPIDDLHAPGTNTSLNQATLAAVQRLAAAAASLHTPLLLAVAAPHELDSAQRRRLSYSAGLHGRPGAVVPVFVAHAQGAGLVLDVSMLQTALLTHAAAVQQGNAFSQLPAMSTVGVRSRL